MPIEILDLTCPKCGGTMEHNDAQKALRCPYCGHEVLLRQTDAESIEAKAYARQKGILHANAEAEKTKKKRRVKVRFIVIGIIAAFVLAAVVYSMLQPKVNPFDYVTVSFTGAPGDGSAEVVFLSDVQDEVDPQKITYRVEPQYYLSEGDRVTVTAESMEYTLSPTSKTFTVIGLDAYLTDLNALSDKAVNAIHNKSDMTVEKAISGAGTSAKASGAAPCMMYLTVDNKNQNTLYDVYKVTYPEKEGGTAERYTVVYYTNIIVRDTEEPTFSYDSTMYTGQIIEALDNGYGGYMTGYRSLKDVKSDILSHQSSAVTLQERAAQPAE